MRALCLSILLIGCGPWDNDGDNFDEATNDCDDSDPNVHPYALEICDGIDNNCDGLIDDSTASGAKTWYADLDRDGYGDDGLTIVACEQPEGYAPNKWDCNESNEFIYPNADEICDGVDNDCDGEIDEATSTDAFAWYPDYDGDGFGNPDLVQYGCIAPLDHIAESGDCNDNDPLVFPTQPESCLTDVDDNCDGIINDEDSIGCLTYYGDLDGDGFPGTPACLCEPNQTFFHVAANDCNDNDATLNPNSTGVDQGFADLNCDGEVILQISDANQSFETTHYGPQNQYRYQRRPIDIEYGDVDGDGLSDFAVSAQSIWGDPTPYVYLQTGAEHECYHELHTFTDVTISGLSTSIYSDEPLLKTIGTMPLEIMDVNRDGLDDLVVVQITESYQWEIATFLSPLAPYYSLEEADIVTSLDLGPVASSNNLYSVSSLQTEAHPDAELLLANPLRSAFYGDANGGGFKVLEFDQTTQEWTTAMDVSAYAGGHYLGHEAESAGDTNGDGVTDFVVLSDRTATLDPFGQTPSMLSGSIALYTDRTMYPSSTIVSNVFYRRIANHFAGQGDFNGDGYDDIAVSARDSYVQQPLSGRTHIFWGPLTNGTTDIIDFKRSLIVGHQAEMEANCPRAVGDVDGDGADDLVIGAPYFTDADRNVTIGATFLWFGQDFEGMKLLNDGTVRIDTVPEGLRRGSYCSNNDNRKFHGGVGDVNGDGFADFLLRGDDSVNDPQMYDNMFLFYGGTR